MNIFKNYNNYVYNVWNERKLIDFIQFGHNTFKYD